MSEQRRLTAAEKEKWASHRGPAKGPTRGRSTTDVVSSHSSSDQESQSARLRKSQPYVGDSASSEEVDELESSDSYSDSKLTPIAKKLKNEMHGPRAIVPRRILWTQLLGDGHIEHEPDEQGNKLYETTWANQESQRLKDENERIKREVEDKKALKHILRKAERNRREAEKRWLRANREEAAIARELGFEFTDEDSISTASETETNSSDVDVTGSTRARPRRRKLRKHTDGRILMKPSVFEKLKARAELEPIKPDSMLDLKGKHAPLLTYNRSTKTLGSIRPQDQNSGLDVSVPDEEGPVFEMVDQLSGKFPSPELDIQEAHTSTLETHDASGSAVPSALAPTAPANDSDELPDFEDADDGMECELDHKDERRRQMEKKWGDALVVIKQEEAERPTPTLVYRSKPPIDLTVCIHSELFSLPNKASSIGVIEVDSQSPLIYIQVTLRTTRRDIGSILDRIVLAYLRDFSPKGVLTTLPQFHFIPALLSYALVKTSVVLPYEYDVSGRKRYGYDACAPLGALEIGRTEGDVDEDRMLLHHLHNILAEHDAFLFARLPPPHNKITPPQPHRQGFFQGLAIGPSGSPEVTRRLHILRTDDPDDREALYLTVVVVNDEILANRGLDHLF